MQSHFSKIADFQKSLLDISDENLEDIKNLINNSPYITSKRKLKILLKCLQIISQIRPFTLSSIISLITFLGPKIKLFFDSDDLFILFRGNFSIIFVLYEINLITIETIFIQSPQSIRCFLFFQFELQKISPSMVQQFWNHCSKVLLEYNLPKYLLYENIKNVSPEDIEMHRQLCIKGRSDEPIARFIQTDDLEQFQSTVSACNIKLDSQIKLSVYESNIFINQIGSLPSLIEYAAFFSAIRIFKFLFVHLTIFPENIQYFAVAGGSYEIIHLLESRDVIFGDVALSTAIEYHRNEIFDYILENFQPHAVISYQSVLLPSIINYNIEILLKHIYDFDLDKTDDPFNWNALLCAAASNHLDIIKFLYKKFNIHLDCRTSINNTAIHIAASKGFDDIIKFLVRENKIDLNETNEKGEAPLHIACKKGYLKIVKLLASRNGININVRNDITNETPLISAAKHGNVNIAEYLIQQPNINPNLLDQNNRNAYNYLPNKAKRLMQLYDLSHKSNS